MHEKSNVIFKYVISLFIILILFLPFVWGIMLSFKSNTEIFTAPLKLPNKFDLSLYVDTFASAHIGRLFMNSVVVTTSAVLIGMLFTFLSSFSIARLYHRYNGAFEILYYFFLLATMLPIFILLLPVYLLDQQLGIVDSFLGLILPYIAIQIPFSTLLLVGGMRAIPLEMEDAGIIDGCGIPRLLFNIEIPMLKPIIATLFIFQFLAIWNEFPLSSIILSSMTKYTVPLALSFFKAEFSMDYGGMLRCVVILLIPQMIFYSIFQKKIIEGMTTVGIKG